MPFWLDFVLTYVTEPINGILILFSSKASVDYFTLQFLNGLFLEIFDGYSSSKAPYLVTLRSKTTVFCLSRHMTARTISKKWYAFQYKWC